MAFKNLKTYNEENFGGMFLLRNDGDFADVIFMYQSEEDALIASTHYIKSNDYNGYVHCNGTGCPACAKGLRVQTKLFIPVYNIHASELQFWDRGIRFQTQLMADVFANYPNPSEYVFRVTRHGAAGSVDTAYEITAVGKNTYKSYANILVENNARMPEYYNKVCAEVDNGTMSGYLSGGNSSSSAYVPAAATPNYSVTPRSTGAFTPPAAEVVSNVATPVDSGETYTAIESAEEYEIDDDVVF